MEREITNNKALGRTGLAVDLREDVLDGLVLVAALGLQVGGRVAPLPAPLHHLSGLRGGEGLQAGAAVQHVLDHPLHRHRSLELHRNGTKSNM